VFHQVAPDYRAYDYDNSDNRKHAFLVAVECNTPQGDWKNPQPRATGAELFIGTIDQMMILSSESRPT
jgi:hypothetical protein